MVVSLSKKKTLYWRLQSEGRELLLVSHQPGQRLGLLFSSRSSQKIGIHIPWPSSSLHYWVCKKWENHTYGAWEVENGGSIKTIGTSIGTIVARMKSIQATWKSVKINVKGTKIQGGGYNRRLVNFIFWTFHS